MALADEQKTQAKRDTEMLLAAGVRRDVDEAAIERMVASAPAVVLALLEENERLTARDVKWKTGSEALQEERNRLKAENDRLRDGIQHTANRWRERRTEIFLPAPHVTREQCADELARLLAPVSEDETRKTLEDVLRDHPGLSAFAASIKNG